MFCKLPKHIEVTCPKYFTRQKLHLSPAPLCPDNRIFFLDVCDPGNDNDPVCVKCVLDAKRRFLNALDSDDSLSPL